MPCVKKGLENLFCYELSVFYKSNNLSEKKAYIIELQTTYIEHV